MKTTKIQVVNFYDNKEIIKEFKWMSVTFSKDSYTNKMELTISNGDALLMEIHQGIELSGIHSDFMQFTAFIPNYDAKKSFKKVGVNCFY